MQWIKIFTSIFGNPKIQLLLKERDEIQYLEYGFNY